MILLEDFAALLGLVFALLGVGCRLITGNLYFDVAGTALIGLLLVAVAIVLAIETKSLLLGESAARRGPGADRRRARAAPTGIERIIHLKTLHLGPEELLVAAKIARRRAAPRPPTSPPPSTRPRRRSAPPSRPRG